MDLVVEPHGSPDSLDGRRLAKLPVMLPDVAIAGAREFALTELDRRLASTPEIVGRFWREVSGPAALLHPDITAFYCFLETGGRRFILVEYVSGETLEDLVKRSDPESCERAIPIFCRLLDAVEGLGRREPLAASAEYADISLRDFGILRVKGAVRAKLHGSVMVRPDGFWSEQVLGGNGLERLQSDPLLMAACQKLTGDDAPGAGLSVQLDDFALTSLAEASPIAPQSISAKPPTALVPEKYGRSRLVTAVTPSLVALGTATVVLLAFFGLGGFFAQRSLLSDPLPMPAPPAVPAEILFQEPPSVPAPVSSLAPRPNRVEPQSHVLPNPLPTPVRESTVKRQVSKSSAILPAPRKAAVEPVATVRVMRGTRPVRQTRLEYPSDARRDGVSGVVELQLTISEDGTVQHTKIVKGHPLLAAGLAEAISKWVYQPIRVDGRPVQTTTEIAVQFLLEK
jgi:protein TonB